MLSSIVFVASGIFRWEQNNHFHIFIFWATSEFDFMIAAVLYGGRRPYDNRVYLCLCSQLLCQWIFVWISFSLAVEASFPEEPHSGISIVFSKRSSYCGGLAAHGHPWFSIVLHSESYRSSTQLCLRNAIGMHKWGFGWDDYRHHVLHCKLGLRRRQHLPVLTYIAILNWRLPSLSGLLSTYH